MYFNTLDPDDDDRENAKYLRKAVVEHFNVFFTLPLKWFGLELQITECAIDGVISYEDCLRQAELFGMDKNGLRVALQLMIKFNLFLWYYDVPTLEQLVFSNPQVILATITELVKSKYVLKKLRAPDISVQNFCKYGFVSEELYNLAVFRERFKGNFSYP